MMEQQQRNFLSLIIGLAAFFYTQMSFAYYCSTQAGRGYINVGDNMSQVQQTCGQPTSTQENEVHDTSFTTTQYWMYSKSEVTRSVPLGVNQPEDQVRQTGPTTTFAISNGRVVSISESGQQVQSTEACGRPVSVGASSSAVVSNCGDPTTTNMQSTPSKAKKKQVIWRYDRGQYNSPLTLTFEDDKLVGIDG